MNFEKNERPVAIVTLDIDKVEIREINTESVDSHQNFLPQVIRIDKKYIDSITTIGNIEEQTAINGVKYETKETGLNEDNGSTSDECMLDSDIKIEPDYEIKVEYEEDMKYYQIANHSGENSSQVEDPSSDEQGSSEWYKDINQKPQLQEKTCLDCNLSFSTKILLREHVLLVHQKKDFRCEKCVQYFIREKALLKHKCYECNICGKIMNHKFRFQRHLRIHIQSDIKEKMPTKWDRQRYECNHCSKSYTAKTILRRHIENVHYGLKYACPQCGKQYSTLRNCFNCSSLEEGEKETCPVCNKVFPITEYFRRHLTHVHQSKIERCSGNGKSLCHRMNSAEFKKTILCLRCTERFTNVNEWMHHLKSESHKQKKDKIIDTWNVSCLICNKVCSRPAHMKTHMKDVHGIIILENKVFHCYICNIKEFTDVNDVARHIESQTHKYNKKHIRKRKKSG
ncbi:hypothetical protein WDU94_011326 [Cyamophila willieti]